MQDANERSRASLQRAVPAGLHATGATPLLFVDVEGMSVVGVHDVEEHGRGAQHEFVLVMEYVTGATLQQWLEAAGDASHHDLVAARTWVAKHDHAAVVASPRR